jgi:uncharacterized protein
MGRTIAGLLKHHRIIALDTCLWIYHFENHPVYSMQAGQVLRAVQEGQCKAVISELVLMELVAGPLKLGKQDVADEYETLLTHFPNLSLAPVTRSILLEAARIRALHGYRTPDAIMLATAKEHAATLVVTNDQTWSRHQELTILNLEE